jgi:hypothetical protein
MRLRLALVALAALAALSAGIPAGAQAPPEVVAAAYRDLPAGLAVRLQLLDDSELNLQVRDLIAEQLAAAGHTVAETAPFVLQIETQTATQAADDPSLGSFQATDRSAEIRMNLWSSTEDSLLQGRQDKIGAEARYRISLGLYDSRDGRYYWRGAASTTLDQGDAAAASRDMVPALLAQFGKTAHAAPATATE